MKRLIPVVIILLIVSTSFVGVGNQVEELMLDRDEKQSIQSSGGLADSPWPMKCHDLHHTSRSPYSTANNSGFEIWRFECDDVESSAVIGEDGTIYFGSDWVLFALNPDGTEKWRYKTGGLIWSAPAVAEDGTIYDGSWDH